MAGWQHRLLYCGHVTLLNPNHLKSQPLSWLYWICTPKPEAAWQKAGTHFPSGGSAKGRSIENSGEP